MAFFADLHVHSKFSRATSGDCDLEHLAAWALRKGLAVVATGDFTHPGWAEELRTKLVPAEPGLFRLRPELERAVAATLPASCRGEVRFLLEVEISSIYKKAGRTRKVHNLVFAPDLDQAAAITAKLATIGNLNADGRPILGLDARDLLEIVLETAPGGFLVPAHIWTPWFAVLGSSSGFDSVEECFGDLTRHLFALETGLSSDPAMNWRLSALDRFRLISNSDAHSPAKLGREANRFECALDYFALRRALETGEGFGGTVEFFPEEGKYHLDGHRACHQRLSPEQTRAAGSLCPACGKPVTVGVLHRVEALADRPEGARPAGAPRFQSLVPLPEVLSELLRVGAGSQAVARAYQSLTAQLGPELRILEELPLDEVARAGPSLLVEGLARLRRGEVRRQAGYDGEYGVIRLFDPEELETASTALLFAPPPPLAPSPHPPCAIARGGLSRWERQEPAHSGPARGIGLPGDIATSRVDPPSLAPRSAEGQEGSSGPPSLAPRSGERVGVRGSRSSENASPQERLLSGLDPDQRAAAQVRQGPLLIVAGPGTGKTRTLTHRIAWLVESGVPPEQCLAITFTRRAADELRERLAALLPDRSGGVTASTFHGLGLSILREHGARAGLPEGFRVLDAEAQQELLARALEISPRSGKRLLAEISRHKRSGAGGRPPGELAADLARYQEALRAAGAVDFDDLVRLTVDLLEEHAELRDALRQRWTWISVDELQDVDPLQYRLLTLLAPPDGNLCAIGDPDQSIYGFRGSDVTLFWRFLENFPAARQVRLGRNYRSSGPIVQAALQAIRPASLVPGRVLQPMLGGGPKVTVHAAPSERAEAEFVVQSMEQLLAGHTFFSIDSGRAEGTSPTDLSFGDLAILFRTEAQADALCEALGRSGLPFQPPASDPDAWDPRAERIALLTLHAAKGLEFRVVFIVGCEDGLLPLRFGPKLAASPEEERRLFFVGMTRAREQLVLSWARRRRIQGEVRATESSPFLADIEKALLELHRDPPRPRPAKPDARQLDLF
jgi:DNA helicase-2/ATP-dependent DNA helicase PcrA